MNIPLQKVGWIMFSVGFGLILITLMARLSVYEYVGSGGEFYDAVQLADRTLTFGLGNLLVITGAIFIKTGVKP